MKRSSLFQITIDSTGTRFRIIGSARGMYMLCEDEEEFIQTASIPLISPRIPILNPYIYCGNPLNAMNQMKPQTKDIIGENGFFLLSKIGSLLGNADVRKYIYKKIFLLHADEVQVSVYLFNYIDTEASWYAPTWFDVIEASKK